MNIQIQRQAVYFLTSWAIISFSGEKRTRLHGGRFHFYVNL